MVVEDMAIIPPRKMESIRDQPEAFPTVNPRKIMPMMMVSAAMMAGPPTLRIFLMLNSSPSAKRRKITPMSAQRWTFAPSVTEGRKEKWGLARKPATM